MQRTKSTDLYYNIFNRLIAVIVNTNIAWKNFAKKNVSEE